MQDIVSQRLFDGGEDCIEIKQETCCLDSDFIGRSIGEDLR